MFLNNRLEVFITYFVFSYLQQYFPKHVQVVFLLQPKGFFQRAFSDMKTKFIKEELEYKVIICFFTYLTNGADYD